MPSLDASTIPSLDDWTRAESTIGSKLPGSLKSLINTFGHGVWGRDWTLFHPKASGYQSFGKSNLLAVQKFVDPTFSALMPGDEIRNWKIIPIGHLPYRLHIFLKTDTEELVMYDGDECAELNTGAIGPANFILESLRWNERELPKIWQSFAEANWASDLPIFTSNCVQKPDGIFAIGP